MATIQATMQLTDRMSGVLQKIVTSTSAVTKGFTALEKSSSSAVSTGNFANARTQLERMASSTNQVEQELRQADAAQRQLNGDIHKGSSAASGFEAQVRKIVAAIGTIVSIKKVFDLSDELTQTTARLNLMNDGLQTTEQLQNMIFQAAQRSRGEYQATANTVARLGTTAKDAFDSNAEIVAFAEQLNKQFVLAGTSGAEATAVMTQLSQALGSGVLRGDELNSVFEQAPTIIQTIADYLDVPIGKIRELASDGQISADIVKNAMLSAADETNRKFSEMPLTIGQVFTSIKNYALMAFQPILQKISELVNSEAFQVLANNIVGVLVIVADAVVWAFEAIAQVAQFVSDNWSVIGPIILGVVAALAVYQAVMLAIKIATMLVAAAQWLWNAAMMASPLTWVLIIIMALVFAFVAFTEQVVGAAFVVAAFAQNVWLWLSNLFHGIWNAIVAIAGNIPIALNNAWQTVAAGFNTMISTVLSGLASIIEWLNRIPGVSIDSSGISNKALDFAERAAAAEARKLAYNDVGAAFAEGFSRHDVFSEGWASKAYGTGAEVGAGIKDSISSILDFGSGGIFGGAADGFIGDLGGDFALGALDAFNAPDIGTGSAGSVPDAKSLGFDKNKALGGIGKNTGKTADNTDKIKNAMDMSREDLKYMRDIAERQAVNRFTTAQINIDMNNNNQFASDMDVDGVLGRLTSEFADLLAVAAEEVHA